MTVIGITGTNGKTTTSYLVEKIIAAAGFSVGVIGTINYRYGDQQVDAPVTTPESSDLQRMLRDMQKAGVTHVVMEVSSHALALNRLDGCEFDVGVFTNLSQDHLDFHKDMISYWDCKKTLFTEFLTTGPKRAKAVAVINQDDPRGVRLAKELNLPVITVGQGENSRVHPVDVTVGLKGIKGCIRLGTDTDGHDSCEMDIHSSLTGEYNLENILCAAGVGVALGITPDTIQRGIDATRAVPGRLEAVDNDAGIFVFVDYAHTPDALENALRNLKKTAAGRLICIAGCGGDRDRAKRPQMAGIAVRLSDLSIFTSDNPRSESPMAIIEDMLTGINNGYRAYTAAHLPGPLDPSGYVVEPDRRQAIRLGINAARAGDTVLIAGKGHETYQIISGKRISFDDRLEAARVLSAKTSNPIRSMNV
jgi:UDP-N-acetylmuramyl-tripeptide synthetase